MISFMQTLIFAMSLLATSCTSVTRNKLSWDPTAPTSASVITFTAPSHHYCFIQCRFYCIPSHLVWWVVSNPRLSLNRWARIMWTQYNIASKLLWVRCYIRIRNIHISRRSNIIMRWLQVTQNFFTSTFISLLNFLSSLALFWVTFPKHFSRDFWLLIKDTNLQRRVIQHTQKIVTIVELEHVTGLTRKCQIQKSTNICIHRLDTFPWSTSPDLQQCTFCLGTSCIPEMFLRVSRIAVNVASAPNSHKTLVVHYFQEHL